MNCDKLLFYKIIEENKDKPWLIMVHGFTQNHKLFVDQVSYFKDKFRILLVDLRGHGESINMPKIYGIQEYVDDIIDLIKELGIESYYYWGTLTGTAIGLILGLRYQKMTLGLILEATVLPGFEMPRVNELIDRAKEITKSEGIESAKKDWFDNADWFEYMRNHPVVCKAQLHREMINEFNGEPWKSSEIPQSVLDVNSRLEELKIPILFYNGKFDMQDFLEVADRMEKVLTTAIRKYIDHAGGFPCWENPKEVNRMVERFLANLCQPSV